MTNKTRKQYHTTPDGERKFVNLAGQTKKVDDSLGNDTDVNNIVARFARTGELPPTATAPIYDDVSNMPELDETLIKGKEAEKALSALNSEAEKKAAEQAEKDKLDLARLREAERLASATVDNTENP